MKTRNLLPVVRSLRAALCAVFTLFSVGALQATDFMHNSISGVDLGNAGRSYLWSIFSLSDGVSLTGNADHPGSQVYDISGNIAVAGNGNLMMSGSNVFGDVWLRYGATKSLSGGASVSGSFIQYPGSGPNTVDPVLNQGIADANAAAAAATALAVSSLYSSITTIDLKNAPLALAAATAANTTYVLKLTDLTLSGSRAVLTLNGGGYANVNYVIDISRYMTLAAGSSIVLTGGLKPENILFNVGTTGTPYDVTLSGKSTLNGIILAPNRNVELKGGSQVNGEVIAKKVTLSGASRIRNPLVSP